MRRPLHLAFRRSHLTQVRLVGLVKELFGIAVVVEHIRVDDLHRDLLPGGVLVQRLERLWTKARVALHRGAELAIDDGLQGIY